MMLREKQSQILSLRIANLQNRTVKYSIFYLNSFITISNYSTVTFHSMLQITEKQIVCHKCLNNCATLLETLKNISLVKSTVQTSFGGFVLLDFFIVPQTSEVSCRLSLFKMVYLQNLMISLNMWQFFTKIILYVRAYLICKFKIFTAIQSVQLRCVLKILKDYKMLYQYNKQPLYLNAPNIKILGPSKEYIRKVKWRRQKCN